MEINIEYDFSNDSKSDPDRDSQELYNAHRILWNKLLPSGKMLEINVIKKYGRLLLSNNQLFREDGQCMNFSSDRMCPPLDWWVVKKHWLTETSEEIERFNRKARTIGGYIVFPAHEKDGPTINQARGLHQSQSIGDRFDLTLECIRRFYEKDKSPLYDDLMRYQDFFDLFVSFDGYVEFFLLQDFIDEQKQIIFTLPFDGFPEDSDEDTRSPFPQNVHEYTQYKKKTIELIDRRNSRIEEFESGLRR